MSLSGKLASKVRRFMTKGVDELYKKEGSSLSKDFTVPKTTQQKWTSLYPLLYLIGYPFEDK